VFNFNKIMRAFAAVAAVTVIVAGTALPARAQGAAPEKKYKDGEYEMYNQAIKDFGSNSFDKAIAGLTAWQQKYPESDYKNERTSLLIQSYSGAKQYSKALATAGALMSAGDLDKSLPANDVIKILYVSTVAITSLPTPSPEETATGEKAARALMAYDQKPQGMDDAAWTQVKGQLQAAAKGALLTIAVRPGISALAKNPQDCDTAESSLARALSDYPDNAYVAYNLGQAYRCKAKKDQTKYDEVYPRAVYEFIRAMVIDPSLGGTQDARKMTDVLTNLYVNYHGGNDGLEELKQQAKANPLPPAGFTIESATKLAERKQKEFEAKYPQLAMWLGIKGQLASANGAQFFNDQMKGADVPKLKGMLVEGKPACRSKELLVSVPEPDQQGTAAAVITLKLDGPLAGKPEAGEIQWKGVPSAFSADPFMLTMDTEKAQIEELKTTPCAAAPARPAAKKGVGTTKKK
jgi:hypothetical protein